MSSSRSIIEISKPRVTRRRFIAGAASTGALALTGTVTPAQAMTNSREGTMQHPGQPPAINNIGPIPMECDAPFLKVVGELPRELNGTLYRNGPNPQFAGHLQERCVAFHRYRRQIGPRRVGRHLIEHRRFLPV